MRVTQTISIGSLRINSMSNTSILQIGTSGSMKSRSENINEYIPQAQADQKIEGKIDKELKKELPKEGLPVEPTGSPGPQYGTAPPTFPYAPSPGWRPDVKGERKNRT